MHAWNGTWGVIAVGLFANKNLVFNAYGPNPRATGPDDPNYHRHFGAWCGEFPLDVTESEAFSSQT